jgi:hypothetical protein
VRRLHQGGVDPGHRVEDPVAPDAAAPWLAEARDKGLLPDLDAHAAYRATLQGAENTHR